MTASVRMTALLLAAPLALTLVQQAHAQAADGPSEVVRAVAIPGTGRVLAVDLRGNVGDQVTWVLDLRSRRWTCVADGPPALASPSRLVFGSTRDEVLSIPGWPGAVWSLTLGSDGDGWSASPVPDVRPPGVTDIALDTRRSVVLAWSDVDDRLWTYEPASNRWSEVPRSKPWPSAAMPEAQRGYTLMAYDSDADRAVLAVLPVPGRPGSTWLLDPASGRWSRQASRPPAVMYGTGEWGTEAVYDPAHGRTVLVSRGAIATYDSIGDRWQTADDDAWPGAFYGPRETLGFDGESPWPHGIPLGALARDGQQVVFDDVHGRILLLGGTALFRAIGADDEWDLEWRPVREVWAYDVGFNSWTRITGGQG